MTTATSNQKPSFELSYDGAARYRWGGQLWECRFYESQTIKPELNGYRDYVGTVIGDGSDNRHDYPPVDLMAHFPGYVRRRYRPTGEKYPFEWTGGVLMIDRCIMEVESAPDIVRTRLGICAAVHARDCQLETIAK